MYSQIVMIAFLHECATVVNNMRMNTELVDKYSTSILKTGNSNRNESSRK